MRQLDRSCGPFLATLHGSTARPFDTSLAASRWFLTQAYPWVTAVVSKGEGLPNPTKRTPAYRRQFQRGPSMRCESPTERPEPVPAVFADFLRIRPPVPPSGLAAIVAAGDLAIATPEIPFGHRAGAAAWLSVQARRREHRSWGQRRTHRTPRPA